MFPFAETFEFICLAGALFYLRKERNVLWIFFIPFLALTLLTELGGKYIAHTLHKTNAGLYDIYLIADFTFVIWILYLLYPNRRIWKPWFILIYSGLLVIYLWESFHNRFLLYNSTTDTISSFVFVFLCGVYYFLLLKDEKYYQLSRFPAFWLVTGLFLFNFGSMVIDLFPDELLDLFIVSELSLRYAIIVFLMSILYGCWIYAFRCRYQETILS